MTTEQVTQELEQEVNTTVIETEATATEAHVVEEPKKRGRKPKTEATTTVEATQTNEDVKTEVTTSTTSEETTKDTPTPTNVETETETDVKETNTGVTQGVDGTKQLGIYKLNEYTQDPTYATTHAACFDIRVNLRGLYAQGITRVKAITRTNQAVERKIELDKDGTLFVDLRPQERLLAPTGAIFDIPVGFSLKVHPRSGTALKQGINLINQEGIIDADYVQELFLPLVNSSDNYVKIKDGERYAQGELQEVVQAKFQTLTKAPAQKSERDGGFGHTGVK